MNVKIWSVTNAQCLFSQCFHIIYSSQDKNRRRVGSVVGFPRLFWQPAARLRGQAHSFAFFSFIFFLLFFISCQTAPKIADAMIDETGFVPLEEGASVYIFADVQNVKPILNNLNLFDTNDKQLQQMIDKTRFAAAAAYLPSAANSNKPVAPLRYQLTAWGKYPSSGAKMALGASKGWKKMRSSIIKSDYWHSPESGLSVAINPAHVFISAAWQSSDTHHDPFSALTGIKVPEGFNAFREGSVLSCWIVEPAAILNRKLAEMGISFYIPAEQLFVSLFPVPTNTAGGPSWLVPQDNQQYEAQLRIEVPSAMQARGLTSAFSLARGFISFALSSTSSDTSAILMSILFANPPVLDDKYLIIKTNALSAAEIALLFGIFSL